jgi:hypothetical protein
LNRRETLGEVAAVENVEQTAQLSSISAVRCEIVKSPMNARNAGRISAWLFGMNSRECPFPSGTPQCLDWLTGWIEVRYPNDRPPGTVVATVLPLRRVSEI